MNKTADRKAWKCVVHCECPVLLSADESRLCPYRSVSERKMCYQFDLVNLINKSLRDIGQIGHGTPLFD